MGAQSKISKVYYFEPGAPVRDITELDPSSTTAQEASWGGLLEFSERANATVAVAKANAPDFPVTGELFKNQQ